MNAALRELLADLKAALAIGDPDSLHYALEQIRDAPDDALPPSGMIPLGETLTNLPTRTILALFEDSDAMIRGAAAVAAARRWLEDADIPEEALLFAADEPVQEVRSAFAAALSTSTEPAGNLAGQWLESESPFVQQTAMEIIQRLPAPPAGTMDLLPEFDQVEDHEFRETLVQTVAGLAVSGQAKAMLEIIGGWAVRAEPNVWVITRALSAAWALEYSPEAIRILQELARTAGAIRPIERALERHQT